MKTNKLFSTRNLVLMAMLSAISTVLMLISTPVYFAPSFYKLDASELPILIGAFAISPVAGIIMEFLKNLLHIMISGSDTAGIGELANFLSGSIFVLTASVIYHRKKTKKTAIISLIIATILMSVASCFINAYITLPAYIASSGGGLTMEKIVAAGTEKNDMINNLYTFLVLAVLPFNLLKCTIVSGLTTILYKYVSPILKGSSSVRRNACSKDQQPNP